MKPTKQTLAISLGIVLMIFAGIVLGGWQINNGGGGGGGGSGTVGSCGAAGIAYYSASGTTITCDTGALPNGSGQVNMKVLGLNGATSGTATFTPPAVAGTTTNPVVSTNQISAPAFVQSAASSGGFLNAGQNANIQWQAGGTSVTVSPNGLANAFGVSTTSTSVGTASIAFTANKGQHFQTQAAANDLAGTCTASTATTCTVTFTTAYTSAPACTVTDQTNITTVKALPSTTNLVITTASSSSDVFSYHCFGNPN